MHRQTVQSSALQSIGYDAQTHTLELEFKEHSGVWQYFGFKPSAYKKFIKSESLGNFFVTKIKGKYKEKKVG
ncbi:KTSC domain-containing protein [Mucilaginibacter psychrotolerans]|uniref:KTSC domain-containing protein n=1 Tax=Mucilaginibacter psychrotolerans TaxID=1524096 RepID=A0A4Y8S958_9SPHI|nr:KTSC domain-containing protein [Mucilaginibacter psychrotolerans]TFF35057.1 KTSC domain-containing protein [Mucilaginibacter psychrotolerans]